MTDQLSLLDTRALAKLAIDPLVNQLRRRVYNFIAECASWGATDPEIAKSLELRPDTARARRNELMNALLVKDGGGRRKTSSGRLAICWVTTEIRPGPIDRPAA